MGTLCLKSCKLVIGKEEAVGQGMKSGVTWCNKAGEVGVEKEMEMNSLSQRQE